MSEPITVVFVPPPPAHPLATPLARAVERVAKRVRVVDHEDEVAPVADEVRLLVGLSAPAPRHAGPLVLSLGLEAAVGAEHAMWIVPASAFGRPLDGVVRAQQLGSVLAACVDLASSDAGRLAIRTSRLWANAGATLALAGSAHLSADAVREVLGRELAARVATRLMAALDEGRGWEIDDWALPQELEVGAVLAELGRGEAAEVLARRALVRAEALAEEVARSVDLALATHGLAALVPLRGALARLGAAGIEPGAKQAGQSALPSDAAVRAAEARRAALPRSVPGGALLAAAWAGPSAVLAGVALGPALELVKPGDGDVLAAALGLGVFASGVGAARALAWLKRKRADARVAAAERDLAAARAELAQAEREAAAPRVIAPALAWFRAEVAREGERLHAIEAHVRGARLWSERGDGASPLNAASAALGGSSRLRSERGDQIDVGVELGAALALIELTPEPLVHAVKSDFATAAWREALPTLADVDAAAAGQLAGELAHAPWEKRSDVAQAMLAPLAQALAHIDAKLERLVPRGSLARRLALVPAALAEVRAPACDLVLPARDDAHLLVCWRPA